MKTVNHNYLVPGFYLCNKIKTGLFGKPIYIYDCRIKKPNSNNYLTIKSAHSIEHLIADTIKKLYPGKVISWNMFMCQTGGYLETYMKPDEAKEALLESIEHIRLYLKEVPFATKEECGNYKTHDFNGALKELEDYARVLESQDIVFDYKELPQNEA